jgi:hypothetical protein
MGGLGTPMDLTPEQRKALQGVPAVPPNTPESLLKFIAFFEGKFFKCLYENGYNPSKHFSTFPSYPSGTQETESKK